MWRRTKRILLERTGIRSHVILAGASFGGFNVRFFASEHPERVAGLILVDASHEEQGDRYAAAGLPTQVPSFAMLVPVAASVGLLRLFGITLGPSPESSPAAVRGFVRATAFRTSRYRAMTDELMHTRDSGAQVKASRRELSVPLVVVSAGQGNGRYAGIHRELQRDQVTLSSAGCQTVAEQSGHLIQHDQPQIVVSAIRQVFDSARSNSTPACK